MTQAYNLSQLANNLNTAGQLDATDGLVNAVPVANGGTGASTAAVARTNLNVPGRDGSDASGTWNINVSGSAFTASELNTTNFTVEQQGSDLVFLYNGTRIAKISASGAITAASDVQAGGAV
jgi:hypothetical protein